jgi:hypothetical protein
VDCGLGIGNFGLWTTCYRLQTTDYVKRIGMDYMRMHTTTTFNLSVLNEHDIITVSLIEKKFACFWLMASVVNLYCPHICFFPVLIK